MIRNYLIVAFRNAVRHRAYVLINNLGLALAGITNWIALPIAWQVAEKWLNKYEYRVEVGMSQASNGIKPPQGESFSGLPTVVV